MSQLFAPEHICYVHCNFCNTFLVVSVPSNSLGFNTVTVRCGHCSNLLSVHLGSLQQTLPLHDLQVCGDEPRGNWMDYGSSSSSKCNTQNDQGQTRPIHPPPEKKQRVPSAYNRFIREEIRRIKENNPRISHKEAFSSAAKNWSHFSSIHTKPNLDEKEE